VYCKLRYDNIQYNTCHTITQINFFLMRTREIIQEFARRIDCEEN